MKRFFPEKCPDRLTAEELQKLEEKLPALQDVAAQAARAIPKPGKSVDPDVLEDLQMATFLQAGKSDNNISTSDKRDYCKHVARPKIVFKLALRLLC